MQRWFDLYWLFFCWQNWLYRHGKYWFDLYIYSVMSLKCIIIFNMIYRVYIMYMKYVQMHEQYSFIYTWTLEIKTFLHRFNLTSLFNNLVYYISFDHTRYSTVNVDFLCRLVQWHIVVPTKLSLKIKGY